MNTINIYDFLFHDETIEKRFWEKIIKYNDPNKCWKWNGWKNNKGYGMIRIGGYQGNDVLAHRLSWILHTRTNIDKKILVCHECDNPECTNILHLFLGTQKDNIADLIKKDRKRCVGKKGERNHNSKLTEEEVTEIFHDIKTHQEIASSYNISRTVVTRIKNKTRWGYLNLA